MQLGWGPYLRNLVVTGNVIRKAPVGCAVSVADGARQRPSSPTTSFRRHTDRCSPRLRMGQEGVRRTCDRRGAAPLRAADRRAQPDLLRGGLPGAKAFIAFISFGTASAGCFRIGTVASEVRLTSRGHRHADNLRGLPLACIARLLDGRRSWGWNSSPCAVLQARRLTTRWPSDAPINTLSPDFRRGQSDGADPEHQGRRSRDARVAGHHALPCPQAWRTALAGQNRRRRRFDDDVDDLGGNRSRAADRQDRLHL